MLVGKFDFERLINRVADEFEKRTRINVTSSAREALIEPTRPHERELLEDLSSGRVTPARLAGAVREVLSTAGQISREKGRFEITDREVQESTKRKCPYVPWC
jgi:hypothetical protein